MRRTEFLRAQTLSGANKCARRNMPELDTSREPGGLPIRKALAFQLLCEEMPLFIGEQELIVGTRTFFNFDGYTESVTWDYPPLIAYPKYANDEDIRRFGGDYSRCNSQHYTPDYSILLKKGIGGILRSAAARKEDPDLAPRQQEFLDSVIIAYTGLTKLIRRYAHLARTMAAQAWTKEAQQRLGEIARVCEKICSEKPDTFREAVQLLWFGQLGAILESAYFINYGRLDVVLTPFYRDISPEDARELLECLLLKMYDQADIQDTSYLKKHEGQLVVTLGGVLENGENAVSPVTMLFLDAIGSTRLPEPEFNLRISSRNPPEFLDKAAELTVSGCNFISYYNDDQIIRALTAAGMEESIARSYGFDLCQDLTIPGKADLFCECSISLAEILMALLCQRQDFGSFQDLMDALKGRIRETVSQTMEAGRRSQENLLRWGDGKEEEYLSHVREDASLAVWDGRHPMCPLPFLSGMFHGTLEKAQDMIYEPYPVKDKGAIVGTAVEGVNSLAAIKQVVYDQKKCTLKELVDACQADYAGTEGEILRRTLWNAPKWGNDDDAVDSIAKDILEFCLREFCAYQTFSGGQIRSGIHQPHPVSTGWWLMATPEGRRKGKPVAVTMTPESGTMKQGATGVLKSASKLDPMLLQWNFCVMINYYASVFESSQGREIFKNLLTVYFDRGGVQHQPNVLDGEQLKKAQLQPQLYKDLIVRLWGVSAHFVDLPRELQDEMIARLG